MKIKHIFFTMLLCTSAFASQSTPQKTGVDFVSELLSGFDKEHFDGLPRDERIKIAKQHCKMLKTPVASKNDINCNIPAIEKDLLERASKTAHEDLWK